MSDRPISDKDERAARRAAQLRANLKKRKAQARGVAPADDYPTDDPPGDDQRAITDEPASTAADAA